MPLNKETKPHQTKMSKIEQSDHETKKKWKHNYDRKFITRTFHIYHWMIIKFYLSSLTYRGFHYFWNKIIVHKSRTTNDKQSKVHLLKGKKDNFLGSAIILKLEPKMSRDAVKYMLEIQPFSWMWHAKLLITYAKFLLNY